MKGPWSKQLRLWMGDHAQVLEQMSHGAALLWERLRRWTRLSSCVPSAHTVTLLVVLQGHVCERFMQSPHTALWSQLKDLKGNNGEAIYNISQHLWLRNSWASNISGKHLGTQRGLGQNFDFFLVKASWTHSPSPQRDPKRSACFQKWKALLIPATRKDAASAQRTVLRYKVSLWVL